MSKVDPGSSEREGARELHIKNSVNFNVFQIFMANLKYFFSNKGGRTPWISAYFKRGMYLSCIGHLHVPEDLSSSDQ
jgi:hypothetical protein